MANKKFSEFGVLASGDVSAANDFLPINDVSAAPAAQNSRITVRELGLAIDASGIHLGVDGSAAAPTYSFAAATSAGLYNAGGGIPALTVGGTRQMSWGGGGGFNDFGFFAIRDLSLTINTGAKLYPDTDNVLAMRNGSGVTQTFRLYRSFADTSNYERLNISWSNPHFTFHNEGLGSQNTSGGFRFLTGTGSGVPQVQILHTASTVNYLLLTGAVTGGAPQIRTDGSDTDITLRFITKGTGAYTFDTGSFDNSQLRIAHTASAVNYFQFTGHTAGNAPSLRPAGSDTNIDARFLTKGTGSHDFWTNTTMRQFRISHTASSVNNLAVTGNVATGFPQLFAEGSDTDVGIYFLTKGTGTHLFSTGGSLSTVQFRVGHIASAVNYLQAIGGVTTDTPVLSAQGTDTNISVKYGTKGTGQHLFYTNGISNPALVIVHAASSVNWVQAQGAATANAPNLAVGGSDTNIALDVITKGTGAFSVWTNSAAPVRQLQVSHTASAVNYVEVTGGATGVGVSVFAGGETNVTLAVSSKGSGNLVLQPNTGDIRWGKALVALGGGAGATLGTIGGSGPATAAQNTWMRVQDSTGAAFWVPAWK